MAHTAWHYPHLCVGDQLRDSPPGLSELGNGSLLNWFDAQIEVVVIGEHLFSSGGHIVYR